MKSNTELARMIVGIIGNFTSFVLFASPAPTIKEIWSKKSVEQFKYHTIVAGIISCMMWIFYSMPFVHPHSMLVTTINSIGLAVYLFYNVVYFRFANNATRKQMGYYYVGELMFMAALVCATLLAFHSHASRSNFVGIFCDIFGIILYASPLTVMYNVISTKSVKYMPPHLSWAGLANGITWTAYSLIKFDLYILIGNVIGAVLAFAQLILYACYRRATPVAAQPQEDLKRTISIGRIEV